MTRCSVSPLIKDTNQNVKVPFFKLRDLGKKNVLIVPSIGKGMGGRLSYTAVRNVDRWTILGRQFGNT